MALWIYIIHMLCIRASRGGMRLRRNTGGTRKSVILSIRLTPSLLQVFWCLVYLQVDVCMLLCTILHYCVWYSKLYHPPVLHLNSPHRRLQWRNTIEPGYHHKVQYWWSSLGPILCNSPCPSGADFWGKRKELWRLCMGDNYSSVWRAPALRCE